MQICETFLKSPNISLKIFKLTNNNTSTNQILRNISIKRIYYLKEHKNTSIKYNTAIVLNRSNIFIKTKISLKKPHA